MKYYLALLLLLASTSWGANSDNNDQAMPLATESARIDVEATDQSGAERIARAVRARVDEARRTDPNADVSLILVEPPPKASLKGRIVVATVQGAIAGAGNLFGLIVQTDASLLEALPVSLTLAGMSGLLSFNKDWFFRYLDPGHGWLRNIIRILGVELVFTSAIKSMTHLTGIEATSFAQVAGQLLKASFSGLITQDLWILTLGRAERYRLRKVTDPTERSRLGFGTRIKLMLLSAVSNALQAFVLQDSPVSMAAVGTMTATGLGYLGLVEWKNRAGPGSCASLF